MLNSLIIGGRKAKESRLFIGIKSAQILDERIVKKLVIVLLAVSGIVLVGINL